MKNTKTAVRSMTEAAVIAALYTVLTLCLAPLSFGPVQLRLSEALTVLPILTPSAVLGLTIGCLISNILGMSMGATLPVDIIFGTAATLLSAVVTRLLRGKMTVKGTPVLSMLSPVVFNALIVGFELTLFFGAGSFPYCALAVGIGELVVVGIAGTLLLIALRKTKLFENRTIK